MGLDLKAGLWCGILFDVGEWRSLEAHLHGVQGAAGSNPVSPTIYGGGSQESLPFCKLNFSLCRLARNDALAPAWTWRCNSRNPIGQAQGVRFGGFKRPALYAPSRMQE